jgi:hypothetical protein
MHFHDERMKVASIIQTRCSFGSSKEIISWRSSWRPESPDTRFAFGEAFELRAASWGSDAFTSSGYGQ